MLKRKKSKYAKRQRREAKKAAAQKLKVDEIDLCLPEAEHCDTFADDPSSPEALRKYLDFARAPAHGLLLPQPHPRLFADHEGRRVRVTMASRFGDVGITTDHDAEMGYELRVLVRQLSNFSDTP